MAALGCSSDGQVALRQISGFPFSAWGQWTAAGPEETGERESGSKLRPINIIQWK
jgi:hypothetical protein